MKSHTPVEGAHIERCLITAYKIAVLKGKKVKADIIFRDLLAKYALLIRGMAAMSLGVKSTPIVEQTCEYMAALEGFFDAVRRFNWETSRLSTFACHNIQIYLRRYYVSQAGVTKYAVQFNEGESTASGRDLSMFTSDYDKYPFYKRYLTYLKIEDSKLETVNTASKKRLAHIACGSLGECSYDEAKKIWG